MVLFLPPFFVAGSGPKDSIFCAIYIWSDMKGLYPDGQYFI